jgi:DNA-binding PadR family transcriptional regulator
MSSPLDSLGRFARPAQQILTILRGGPAMPIAIRGEVRVRCGDDIGPGTLFGAIARLERRGLVEVMPSATAPRAYRITGLGAMTLEALLKSGNLRRRAPQPSIRSAAT